VEDVDAIKTAARNIIPIQQREISLILFRILTPVRSKQENEARKGLEKLAKNLLAW
jgi:hypothetical protein